MPWPLTSDGDDEVRRLRIPTNIAFEDYPDPEEPTVRRFRAGYRREPT